jgi:hypothetical protein
MIKLTFFFANRTMALKETTNCTKHPKKNKHEDADKPSRDRSNGKRCKDEPGEPFVLQWCFH